MTCCKTLSSHRYIESIPSAPYREGGSPNEWSCVSCLGRGENRYLSFGQIILARIEMLKSNQITTRWASHHRKIISKANEYLSIRRHLEEVPQMWGYPWPWSCHLHIFFISGPSPYEILVVLWPPLLYNGHLLFTPSNYHSQLSCMLDM